MRKTPQHFKDQINSLGIPKSDTVGLRVTNRAPAGFNTVNGRFVNNGKKYAPSTSAPRSIGLYVSGRWFARKGDVHLVKGAGVESLVHEIGHHVTMKLNDQSGIEGTLSQLIKYLAREYSIGTQYGLRQYSLKNWKELLADCYKVRYCGTKKQWGNLVNFFGVYGVDLVAVTAA